ncbi:hypothetical protein UlMin_037629 [Ulmus minor]
MRNFHDSLSLCGLKDLSFLGEKFTWVNKQVEATFIQARLDKYARDVDWCNLFPIAHVSNLSFYHFDHRAIKVTLGNSSVWVCKSSPRAKKMRFHFEEIWAMDDECRELVVASWNSPDFRMGVEYVKERLGICAKKIDEWGFKKFGRIRSEIEKLQ